MDQQKDLIKFRFRSFTKLNPVHYFYCGSKTELPIKYSPDCSTDIDYLSYCYDICAIPWNRNPPKNTKCTILRIDSTETPSGYARLKVDGDSLSDRPSYYRRPRMLANLLSGGASIQCVETVNVKPREGINRDIISVSIDVDDVFAIYCPYWPLEAEEWRKRTRFNGWPNEKLIARITRGGCHFVSKLRTWSSSCDDSEWRFSFSKAELLLIHSWTNVQKFVYHIIRSFKKYIEKFVRSKGLQTYYFKTLMFWACEEFSAKFWRGDVIVCVETLLFRFLGCLEDKLCPSYFIPKCNIMCHLKDEGSFEEVLQIIYKELESVFVNFALSLLKYEVVHLSPRTSSVEANCFTFMSSTFPINEDLNGRFAQHLLECEWFLPEIKYLHAAVEAHVRLMSIDNVASRKEHKDFIECLENFKSALIRNDDFNSFKSLNPELSFYENVNVVLVRKLARNSIPIYHRHLRMSFDDDAYQRNYKDSLPSLLFCAVLAYRANFYFTAIQSFEESLTEFNRCVDIIIKEKSVTGNTNPHSSIPFIPVLICNSLSQIYDEHLQVILGFATLHRNISSLSDSSTAHEVCLKLNAWEFLKYLSIQCDHKLSGVSVMIDYYYYSTSNFHHPTMSKLRNNAVDSATILFAALRQSMVYIEQLKGILIPLKFFM